MNLAHDAIELCVVHSLLHYGELHDHLQWKESFRSRALRAVLADAPPSGREITVARRAFLARAARIRKAKPKKISPR